MTSPNALKIIASSDHKLFESILHKNGMVVVGRERTDEIDRTIQNESIVAISSTINESTNNTLSKYQLILKKVAYDNGYIVALKEGLDQMPGTDVDPIKAELRNPTSKEELEQQENEGEEDEEGGMPIGN